MEIQEKEKNMHKDHRKRVKERFCVEGLDNFSDFQVLEMLLFYAVPRVDTNPLAHRLISHFGSLSQVLEAPVAELQKVEGVGEHAAILISLSAQLSRYYQVNRHGKVVILDTTEKYGQYLISQFQNRRNETVFLLCLDAKCKVICCREVGEGDVNSAGISVRRIVELALGVNATTVVLAHNHPGGVALPSAEDVLTTKRIARALLTVDILLLDHIIVSDDDFVSLGLSGKYSLEEIRSEML